MPRLTFGNLVIAVMCCWPLVCCGFLGSLGPVDIHNELETGEIAKNRLAARLQATSIEGASEFMYWEGGSFDGHIEYWACTCKTIEDCWKLVTHDSRINRIEFTEWKPSKYKVVMFGPAFYHSELETRLWNIASIQHGMSYELVIGNHYKMIFYAIDLERKRVYYHYESGGFPKDTVK